MKVNARAIWFSLLLVAAGGTAEGQTAEEIVRRAENARRYESAYMEARMVNHDTFGSKTIEYRLWAREDRFLLEFTSDAERGQRILRTEDRVYHFFPDSEAVFVRSAGDQIIGLISYEDVTRETEILEEYTVALEGEETIGGRRCYRVAMEVKERRRVAYPRQTAWIDAADYTIRRVEMFTRRGESLKTMEVREFRQISGVTVAVDAVIVDEVRPEVRSEIFVKTVDLDQPLPENLFTRRELTR